MLDWDNAQTGPKCIERRCQETLCHHVSELFGCWNMKNTELAQLNAISDEMNVQLDVLRSLVMDQVRRHVNRRNVVADRRLGNGTVQLAEELPEPNAFGRGIRHGAVLSFRARA
jgi:hypothetical protein